MVSMKRLISPICTVIAALSVALAATPIDVLKEAIQLATPNQFPFMVGIANGTNGKYCSGAVVSSNAIITSASCVYGVDNAKYLDVVLFGTRQNVLIEKIYTHPQYNIFPFVGVTSADLAVLRSEQKIETNGYSSDIVKLPSVLKKYESYAGKSALLAASNLSNSTYLSYSEVIIMNQSSCQKFWSKMQFKLQGEQMCVETSIPCQVGGGGAVTISDKGFATIVAIAPGFDLCHASQPIVYTRIGPYIGWIQKMAS
ncbi:Hypothetical predicted protein [Cloeon dipterum]|uniref:Peptidase S1 domain-containing protein n=1 Tax=Cloeon dipterum TaxID=197152 RepID=A0A8S1DN92_9INSE|nr:Hypothetical predicted protein [Cloeon dipterum]